MALDIAVESRPWLGMHCQMASTEGSALRLVFSTVLARVLRPWFFARTWLPLAEVAPEAHALGDPESRDDAPLDLLAGLPAVSHVRRYSLQDW